MAELARTTPGMSMPEVVDQDDDESAITCTWDTQDFASEPGQPPQLWACWAWGLRVWQHMADQWRVGGMGGVIGLDLAALPIVEQRIGMPETERQCAYQALRVFARMQQDEWVRQARRKGQK